MLFQRRNMFRGFLLYLFVLTAMMAFFIFGIMRFFSASIFDQIEAELDSTARMVNNMLLYMQARDIHEYDAFCKRLGEDENTRITLIAADGRVLGDSHANIGDLGNHGDRPEVLQAFQGPIGVAVRHSASLGYRLMYLALPVRIDGNTIIIRTSRSVKAIDAVLSRTSRTLLILGAIFFVAALYAAASTGQWIRKPLQRLMTVASALAAGDLEARADVFAPDEFRILGQTLNSMAANLTQRIDSIQRQRDEYQSVLAGMSEAVIVLDGKLTVLETNRAAERIFMQDRKRMIGLPLLKAVRNLALNEFAEKLLTSEQSMSDEFTLHLNENSGRMLYIQVHGASLPQHEHAERQAREVLVFTDITGIKQSEQIRKDFVSNVSHELKTPITSIKGFVETLMDGASEDTALLQRFLGIILKQADNMHAIIEDLLQLSRLDERSLSMAQTMVDLNEVIEIASEKIKESAREKNMQFSLEGVSGMEVQGNQGLLEQAVFNLLDNAVKYSEPKGVIRATLRREGGEGVITVLDSGVGIPEEDLPRIFERFYRVDKARSRETGGTGLGLAIVKHIVHVHGGRVLVESTFGEGSAFSIFLPLAGI